MYSEHRFAVPNLFSCTPSPRHCLSILSAHCCLSKNGGPGVRIFGTNGVHLTGGAAYSENFQSSEHEELNISPEA